MEKDTEFYKTYIYFIFAEGEFYPIGGGKGSPEFEERLEEIKKSLEEKNYNVTRNDIEVRKDTITIWNCPGEDKIKSFVDAIFELLIKIDITIDVNLSLNILLQAMQKILNQQSKVFGMLKKILLYAVIPMLKSMIEY